MGITDGGRPELHHAVREYFYQRREDARHSNIAGSQHLLGRKDVGHWRKFFIRTDQKFLDCCVFFGDCLRKASPMIYFQVKRYFPDRIAGESLSIKKSESLLKNPGSQNQLQRIL